MIKYKSCVSIPDTLVVIIYRYNNDQISNFCHLKLILEHLLFGEY